MYQDEGIIIIGPESDHWQPLPVTVLDDIYSEYT